MRKLRNFLLVLGILISAGTAVFLAQKLYELRKEPITPTAPRKAEAEDEAASQCKITFVVVEPSPMPTNTPGPSSTPTLTPSPVPGCWEECEFDQDCADDLVCRLISGAYRCCNPDCPGSEDCHCPPPTTPTPTPTVTSIPALTKIPTPTVTKAVSLTPTSTPAPTNTPVPTSIPTGVSKTALTPTTFQTIGGSFEQEVEPTRIELPRAGGSENIFFSLLFGGITLGLGLLFLL